MIPRLRLGVFARAVLVVGGGTAAAQILGLAFAPILARIFDPSAFGVFAIFASLLALGQPLASMRLELGIPIEEADQDADALAGLALGMVMAAAGLSLLLVSVMGDPLASLLGRPDLAVVLWWLPWALLGMGASGILLQRATRRRAYRLVARATTMRALVQGIAQISLGLGILPSATMLAAGVSLAWIAAALTYVTGQGRIHVLARRSRWRRLARRHRDFARFTVPGTVLGMASLHLAAPLLAFLVSAESAGHFAMSMRVLGAPAMLIGGAIAQVLYPEAARLRHDLDGSARLIGDISVRLICIGAALFGIVGLHARELFPLVLGEQWGPAGEMAAILCVGFWANFVSSPLASYVLVHQRQRQQLLAGAAIVVGRTGAVVLGVTLDGIDGAIIGYSAASLINSIFWVLWVMRVAQVPLSDWLREHMRTLVGLALGLAGASALALLFRDASWPMTLVGGIVLVTIPLLPLLGANTRAR